MTLNSTARWLFLPLAALLAGCTANPVLKPAPEAVSAPIIIGESKVLPPAAKPAPRVVTTARSNPPSGPAGNPTVPQAQPVPPLVISAQSVFFPIGSNDITNAGRRLLQDIADRMKGRPRMHVTLIGHTDDAGSAEFNIALAQRRVDTVSSELISLGVSVRQIRRISYGDEAGGGLSCSTEACRQQKRRVELRVSDD